MEEIEDNNGTDNIILEHEIVEEPKKNMMFDMEQDVLLYYTKYVKQAGFDVTRTYRSDDDGNLNIFTLHVFMGAH